jgi:crotonobetaine/carnitine-CoA ligase
MAGINRYAGADLGTRLADRARAYADAPFMLWDDVAGADHCWTYAQFRNEVLAIAAGLQSRGIGLGDRILLHSDNHPDMVVAWYACALIGAMAVTTNTHSTASELNWFIEQAQPRAAIAHASHVALIGQHAEVLNWIAVLGGQIGAVTSGMIAFEALRGDAATFVAPPPDPMRPAGIMYTSGTTSRPKAVVHSHGNYLWAGDSGARNTGFEADDVHFAQLPFFHTNAQLWTVAVALSAGGSFLLIPKLTVTSFWPLVARYGITHASFLPLVMGAQKPPPPFAHRTLYIQGSHTGHKPMAAECGAELIACYGMSETVTQTLLADPSQNWPEGTMGKPVTGYAARVVDMDSGELCLSDIPGELQIKGQRGVQLFLEYGDNANATAAAFVDDGWFRTGDIVRADADGCIYYEDRGVDRLKVGGENVSALEVEQAIMQVAGVAKAAVVAKPDPSLGEVPLAFVIPAGDLTGLEAAIIGHCREVLSRFKCPRTVVFLDEFPSTLSGAKVDKKILRTMC